MSIATKTLIIKKIGVRAFTGGSINSAASPVGVVPEFNCCGINFCRQTKPNFAWKIQLYGYQKMGNFELNTDIFSAAKYVFV